MLRRKCAQQTNDAKAVLTAVERSQAVIKFARDGTIITANTLFLTLLG